MGGGPGGAGSEGARLPLHLRDPTLSSILPLAILGLWALLFVRGLLGLARTPRPRPRKDLRPERVVAYVPARNEAEIIERAVSALLRQLPALSRAVVIDDRSTDDTRAILARLHDPRLHLVSGPGPGPGECGKPAALLAGLAASPPDAEWLLFLDADVVLEEGALGALLAEAAGNGADLVSLVPAMELGSALEELVLPYVGSLILAARPPARVNDPQDRRAFANGQLILVRRSVYERAGTHRVVAGEILEDVRLAERVKAAGGRLWVVDGRHLARTRMYAGAAELFEGWAKNLYLLLGGRPLPALGWLGLSLLLAWAGPLAALSGGWPLGVAVYSAVLAMQVSLRALGGAGPLWALLAPLSSLLVGYILLKSWWLHRVQRRVPWKGRSYHQ